MANVVRDPKIHPDAIIPDLSKPDPLVTFTKRRHRLHLRQQVEAALLHQGGRRLLSARRAVGRHPQAVVALLRRRWHRLVGAELSRPTTRSARPARSATAVTRWTTTCRPSRSPNGTSAARNVTAPAASTRRARRAPTSSTRRASIRCTPTTPASSATRRDSRSTNPIAGRYYDWPVGFRVGLNLQRFLEARRARTGQDDVHALRGRHGAQEPDAGQRLRAEPDVHARRHLRQLPRRPRHGEQRGSRDGRSPPSACSATAPARRTARTPRPSSSTPTTRPDRPATSASRVTCRRSRRKSAT